MRFFRSRSRSAGSRDATVTPVEPSEQRGEPPAQISESVGERSEPEPASTPEPEVTPGPALEPAQEPETEAPPEPAPAETPPEQPRVGTFTTGSLDVPRQWNLWELERVAREQGGTDPTRDEERSLLLMYLRDFAAADGVLPTSFDRIVRESFGDVLDAVGS
jgi:hypothetical protein